MNISFSIFPYFVYLPNYGNIENKSYFKYSIIITCCRKLHLAGLFQFFKVYMMVTLLLWGNRIFENCSNRFSINQYWQVKKKRKKGKKHKCTISTEVHSLYRPNGILPTKTHSFNITKDSSNSWTEHLCNPTQEFVPI